RPTHRHLSSFPTRRSSDLSASSFADQCITASFRADSVGVRLDEKRFGPVVIDPDVHVAAVAGTLGKLAPPPHPPAERQGGAVVRDRKSTRLNSSHVKISYA